MNNRFEVSKFKPDPTFDNAINEIKDNHQKIFASAATNISAITSFENNSDPLCINNSFEAATFEPEPTFEKTINEIKSNHLKSITSIDINISSITSNKPPFSSEHLRSYLVPWILLQSPEKSPQFTIRLS